MTKHLSFVVPGTPVAQGSMTHVGRGRFVHPPALVQWRDTVLTVALLNARNQGWPVPYDGPVALHCVFWLPRPKRPRFDTPATGLDLDKLTRAIGDALSPRNGQKVLTNDARITQLTAEKRYARPGEERATIHLREVPL